MRRSISLFGAVALAGVIGCSSNSTSLAPMVASQAGVQHGMTGTSTDAFEAREAALRVAATAPKDRSRSTFDRAAFNRVLADPFGGFGLLFANNAYDGSVDIFIYNNRPGRLQNQQRIAHLTGFQTPSGIAIDARGELFVADQYANQVEEFTLASYPNPAHIYAFPYAPTGIAVTPSGSDIYVSADVAFPNGQLGVAAFKRNAATPYAFLSDPHILRTVYPFLDNAGGVYLGVSGFPQSNIGVFRSGSPAFQVMNLANTVQQSTYEGALDTKGDLIVSDPNGSTIDTYANNNAASVPSTSFGVPSGGNLIFFTIAQPQTQLFATTLQYASTGYLTSPILQYGFPSGTQDNAITGLPTAQYVFGLATFPVSPLMPAFNHPTTLASPPTAAPSAVPSGIIAIPGPTATPPLGYLGGGGPSSAPTGIIAIPGPTATPPLGYLGTPTPAPTATMSPCVVPTSSVSPPADGATPVPTFNPCSGERF